jgi:hypothetical protein
VASSVGDHPFHWPLEKMSERGWGVKMKETDIGLRSFKTTTLGSLAPLEGEGVGVPVELGGVEDGGRLRYTVVVTVT